MLDFTFENHTKTIFGKGAEANVGQEVARYTKKVLLHYGGGSIKKSGLYDRIVASLKEAEVEWVELGGVQPNPLLSLVRDGIAMCRRENVGMILAVGGGSVIDSAKTIAMGTLYDGDVWDFYTGHSYAGSLPVGVVLTIPAAGSESSCDAVLTNEESMLKRASCASPELRPVFAIMNPEITFTLPDYQSFCGVTDIMAHILERYFTNTKNVEVSDRLCEGLLLSVMRSAATIKKDAANYQARAEIMWAGSLAHNNLCGVDRQQDWACHMMGHEISAQYGATHGATLGMLFPNWMQYVRQHDLPRAMQFANRVMGVDYNPTHPDGMAMEGIRRLRSFFDWIGMPSTFAQLGIKTPDIELLADKCTDSNQHTVGGYVPLGKDAIITIYKMCI